MHPFEILAEPIRRRIVEILASGEHFSGDIEAVIIHEFGVGRSAVQHHLAVFRRNGWVIVRQDWNERGYRLHDDVVPRLELEVRRIKRRWTRRIGFVGGVVPHFPTNEELAKSAPTRRGRRGHGIDPDDPWRVMSD